MKKFCERKTNKRTLVGNILIAASVLCCLMAVLIVVLEHMPIYSYSLDEDFCKVFFGCSPEEFVACSVEQSDYLIGFDVNARVDENGRLIIKLSSNERKTLKQLSNSVVNDMRNDNILLVEEESKLVVILDDNTDISVFNEVDYTKICIMFDYLLKGHKTDEYEFEYVICNNSIDNVVCSWNYPFREMIVDNGVPCKDFTISNDFCEFVFGCSPQDFAQEYDFVDFYEVNADGSLRFSVSVLEWLDWIDVLCQELINEATEKIEISEDYTDITVTYTDVSYSPLMFDRNYVINETDTQNTVDYIRRLCCLKQLLEGKSEEEIEVTTTSICEETGEVIDIVNLTIKNGVVNYFRYTVNYNKK